MDLGTQTANRKVSNETFQELKEKVKAHLNNNKVYVTDAYCGASLKSRIKVRVVCEFAWQAHFCKNMFIRPSDDELDNFKPDWTILNACKTTCERFTDYGLRSEVFVAFNITERMTVIGGTWYGGEIKKGIFSIMNYFLPLKDIGAFHCRGASNISSPLN